MKTKHGRMIVAAAFALGASSAALGQTFDLSWYTIDGGGVVGSSGGAFEMSSTIGQPDAATMSGGDFELTGGFWAVAGSSPCDACDMNCDGEINAFDIEPFLDLLFGGGGRCAPCTGDVDGNGEINAFDIEPFLECLFP